MKHLTLSFVIAGALAHVPQAQGAAQELLQASATSGSAVLTPGLTLESDLQPTDQGAWHLAPGASLTFAFELPAGLLAGLVAIEELGQSDATARAQIAIALNDEQVSRPASAPGPALWRELPLLADHLRAGSNELVISNPNAAGAIGVRGVKISYVRKHPQGRGRTADYVQPLPWDGSGDATERKPRERENPPVDVEVQLTLLAPLPEQSFAVGDNIFIEWEAAGFPPGSGVSLHYRTGSGPWLPVEGAQRLAFNEPTREGNRGHFVWHPAEPLSDVRIGIGFVEKARRDALQHVVGGEGGLPTIAAALARSDDGDTILLRAGTYREEVVLYTDVKLIGEDRERCVILSPESRGIVVALGVTASISNLTIDGGIREAEDLNDAWGLHVAGGTADVRGVTARNVFYGLVANWKAQVDVQGLLVEGATRGLVSTRGADTRVKESEFLLAEVPGCFGAAVWLGGKLNLTDVRVLGQARGSGFQAQDEGSRITARDCTIASVTSGVTVYDQAEVDLTSVACSGAQTPENPMTGLYVVGGAKAKATTCTFTGFSNPGVTAQDAGSSVEVIQSEISHNNYHGVLIASEAHAIVRSCKINDNKNSGIQVMRGATAEITSNTIDRNRWGIYLTEEPGRVTIRSNSASHNTAYGYYAPGVNLFGNRGSNNAKGLIRNE